ncbi:MAG: glutamate racemase [Aquincola tertiaricarbonis]|uniref:glutamate racemase n=1 Tax=Aquincola TaxID=391952 RepID=UPI0006150DD4|nr:MULTISPECIES: glutamate racemase [Aquincola]MCR5864925.1 glutamate racemase [Aquincola sp. J276]
MTTSALPVHIGVFDSGLGGLSVLRALRHSLPAAQLSYLADSGHAPYGERDAVFVSERTARAAAFLREQGAQLLVIACNTATAAAVAGLRQAMPDWPIVGLEPGLKPALALTRRGSVGVMATQGTLCSPRFVTLKNRLAAAAPQVRIHLQACVGLARAIEQHSLHSAEVGECIERHAAPLRAAGCDVVVLGCTHYPLVAGRIQAALGQDVQLVDTADAVARRTVALATALPALQQAPGCTLWSTGDPAKLQAAAERWAGVVATAGQAPV